jgi:hypothetical protein
VLRVCAVDVFHMSLSCKHTLCGRSVFAPTRWAERWSVGNGRVRFESASATFQGRVVGSGMKFEDWVLLSCRKYHVGGVTNGTIVAAQ